MPNNDDYLRLRRMTGEVGSDAYSDTDLELIITESAGDLNAAAAVIWGEKASGYADLVDISEAGSSRKNSDLFNHARTQQGYFERLSSTGASDPDLGTGTNATTTRRIVRP